MILAAESFFFYSGACLFVLGIITCFIPRHMRLGIVSMLIGDALFAAGIAFLVKSFLHYSLCRYVCRLREVF